MLVSSGGGRESPQGCAHLTRSRHRLRPRYLCLVPLLVVALGCDPGASPPPSVDSPRAGGTFRQELPALPFDGELDPTSEYTSMGFALHSNLLSRPLMNYRHVAGVRGNQLVPDLADGPPEVSEDGLTYTFTLKEDARFGPPVNRAITSQDIGYAFERMESPEVGAPYKFYFESAIEGMIEFGAGSSDEISGIETPDERTIVFHLLRPTGDFLYRLAMPAAAPIPQEVADCYPDSYGRHLVSSGPYMIAGSGAVSGEVCDGFTTLSGFEPDRRLVLVRNPSFEVARDDPRIRDSLVDRFEFVVVEDPDEILERVESGDADLSSGTPSFDWLRRYASRRRLRDNLHVQAGDRIWYISLNLTVPPFDDVHVRRAASFVMDKDSLVRSWGGPLQGEVATHAVPDAMLGGKLQDYNPYPSRDHAGDIKAAKAEMRKSRYDTDGDGICDDEVCDGVIQVSRDGSPWSTMALVVEASLNKIGIEVDTKVLDDPYSAIQEIPNDVALTSIVGWGKDYPDPYSFIGFLFDGRNIVEGNNANYSFVGLTRERARELGIDYPRGGVPNIDSRIDRCSELTGSERTDCWVALDRSLMEEVVPWIPYLDANHLLITSDVVRPFEFDQFSGEAAYARVGIVPEGQ